MCEEAIPVPRALKNWFIVHFIADITFAVPLFILPEQFLTFMGWSAVDPITARMVAAALFGIGTESLLSRNSTIDSFKTMLDLKIIWSLFAVFGLLLGLINGLFNNIYIGLFLLITFILFNILWTYWKIKISKLR